MNPLFSAVQTPAADPAGSRREMARHDKSPDGFVDIPLHSPGSAQRRPKTNGVSKSGKSPTLQMCYFASYGMRVIRAAESALEKIEYTASV